MKNYDAFIKVIMGNDYEKYNEKVLVYQKTLKICFG